MKITSKRARYFELIALRSEMDIKSDAILLFETRLTDGTEDSKLYQISHFQCIIARNRKTTGGVSSFLKNDISLTSYLKLKTDNIDNLYFKCKLMFEVRFGC